MTRGGVVAIALVGALSAVGCASSVSASDAGADVPTGRDVSQICQTVQATLGQQLISPGEGRLVCSVVVRLDQTTLQPIGYQPFCGRYATTTDAQAAALAEAAMIPYAAHPPMISPSMPDDAFVFYAPPGDLGGIVVVSPRLGATVFAATVVWGGGGRILQPTAWRDGAELAGGCGDGARIPRARGYNLGAAEGTGTATVDRVVAAVERTVLPGALAARGSIFDAVVVGYVPGAGGAAGGPSEWVVVVNGGWTE